MKNIYLTNWTRIEEQPGGCEYVFDMLHKFLPGSQTITATDASEIYLGNRDLDYRPYSIMKKVKLFRDFFMDLSTINKNKKLIIANDNTMPEKNPDCFLITYAQNPFFTASIGLYNRGYYNRSTFYELGELYPEIQKSQYQQSDKIVSVSEYMKEYVKQISGKDSTVIEHGVDTDIFKPMDKKKLREKYNLPQNKRIGIWVGAFHPFKSYENVPYVVRKYKDIHWILVFKNDINESPISKNVTLFNKISHKKLAELYNCADFNLHFGMYETFNLTSVEAMACGIPVITHNSGYFYKKDREKEISIEPYGMVFKNINPEIINFALCNISGYNFSPRQHVIDNDLTLDGWKKRWETYLSQFENNTIGEVKLG